jgi:hypothetical protein
VTLEEALDELYGVPLENFVAERNRLAKELGGDEGNELAKLRKPNVAAWALNQLARQSRRDVDLLLDAGHRMRQAGVQKDAFEQARAKEANALRRLTKAAEGLGISDQTAAKVNAALRAAAVTEQGRELLALGRFVDLPTASGFEAYEGLELPKRPKMQAAAKPAARPRRDSPELKDAKAALREAEKKLRAARAAADAAAAEVDAAERRLRKFR